VVKNFKECWNWGRKFNLILVLSELTDPTLLQHICTKCLGSGCCNSLTFLESDWKCIVKNMVASEKCSEWNSVREPWTERSHLASSTSFHRALTQLPHLAFSQLHAPDAQLVMVLLDTSVTQLHSLSWQKGKREDFC